MLKVRARETAMQTTESPDGTLDATVIVVAEVFADQSGYVLASTPLTYTLSGMDGWTAAEKQQRVRADAERWAAKIKARAEAAAPILSVVGIAIDIP